jgi:hypothetical protein
MFQPNKRILSTTPILTYSIWKMEFRVHIDASVTMLGPILAQPGEGNLNHPVYFSSIKLSHAEDNFTATESEGLAMVYALQKLIHYLLGECFKFFTDHSSLKYLVKKPVLEGILFIWFF